MAARNKLTHAQKTRERIQASMIVNRLIEHSVAKATTAKGQKDLMTTSQVTAALGLLRKIVPDLSNISMSNEDDNPLVIEIIKRVVVDPK